MILILPLLFLFVSNLNSTEVMFSNNKIVFPYATVDRNIAWTKAEHDDLKEKMTVVANGTTTAKSPTVVIITPEKWETNISTIMTCNGKRDFEKYQTKEGVLEEMIKLKQRINAFEDTKDTVEKDKEQEKYNWLVHFYGNGAK